MSNPRPISGLFRRLACLAIALTPLGSHATGIFSNTTPNTVPTSGAASTYPSTINVSGMLGNVTKVVVRLEGLNHTWPDDLWVRVQGPTGATVILMGNQGLSFDVSGVTLSFDSSTATTLPDSTQIVSGTYQPSSVGSPTSGCDPAPAGTPAATSSTLATFNGLDPNGAWKLYVCDDNAGDSGSLSGWSLVFNGATALALESPTASSNESGVGLIRGWACDASRIDITIDSSTNMQMSYGADRPDTAERCGDSNNGFGAVVNWNRSGNGIHNLKAYRDGVQFADVNFFITTLGVEYLTGASGHFLLTGFPDASRNYYWAWSEPHQGFVVSGGTGTPNPSDSTGDATHNLESPTSGSTESGVGLIRGWACSASEIQVVIDSDAPIEAPYGTERLDTAGVCGDTNNGWGVVVNWNRYTAGVHQLRVLADGTQVANVHFHTSNLGVEYLTGMGNPSRVINNFPAAGNDVTVTWSEPHQGVVITNYAP